MNYFEEHIPHCLECKRIMDMKSRIDGYYWCQYCGIIWDSVHPGKKLDKMPKRTI